MKGNDFAHPSIKTEPKRDQQYSTTYSNTYSTGGLTIREHFASLSMAAMVSSIDGQPNYARIKALATQEGIKTSEWIAKESIKQADALIKELNK